MQASVLLFVRLKCNLIDWEGAAIEESCPVHIKCAPVGHVALTTTRNPNISPSYNSYIQPSKLISEDSKNPNKTRQSTAATPNSPPSPSSPSPTADGTILLPTPPTTPLQPFQPSILPLSILRRPRLRPQHPGSSPVFLPVHLWSPSTPKQRLRRLRRSSARGRERADGGTGGLENGVAGSLWDGGV